MTLRFVESNRPQKVPTARTIPVWGVTQCTAIPNPRALKARPIRLLAMATLMLCFIGCKTAPSATTTTSTHTTQTTQYPPRPTTLPPPFKLFHQTSDSFTIVTSPTATDTQIAALIYQLRDAAHTHTFDALQIPQKLVDARDPMVWFHIYRGQKCADEKYTDSKLPCGASYHAAGDYTFGGGANHQWDDGVLLHGEDHQTELWNPNAPYEPFQVVSSKK